jgi:hypothetical protein
MSRAAWISHPKGALQCYLRVTALAWRGGEKTSKIHDQNKQLSPTCMHYFLVTARVITPVHVPRVHYMCVD